jgi:zinc/manganese transport system substrate-binding protein
VKVTTALWVLLSLAAAVAAAGCGPAAVGATIGHGPIVAVGAENEYADVISQIGGRYVMVSAIESNPNADPHSFEASPSIAHVVATARLIVQNSLGYDAYMNRIEAASPSASRHVIDVQALLGLPDSTPNPHLWYLPRTMPLVAQAIARDLSAIDPSHAAYYAANAKRFDASLQPWYAALKAFATKYRRTPVAVTEPVGDYALQAAGAVIKTPFTFQADVMNGVDPSPQGVTLQNGLFDGRKVKVFLYNQQVTDSLTESLLARARRDHIPVVGLYETMPTPGYDYQSWMLAEIRALQQAVADGVSTERLR